MLSGAMPMTYLRLQKFLISRVERVEHSWPRHDYARLIFREYAHGRAFYRIRFHADYASSGSRCESCRQLWQRPLAAQPETITLFIFLISSFPLAALSAYDAAAGHFQYACHRFTLFTLSRAIVISHFRPGPRRGSLCRAFGTLRP